jgi:hypothetical protein
LKNLGLIIPYDYKLLSIAAILDVFETVKRICRAENRERPFDIHVFRTPDQIEKDGAFLHGYPVTSIKSKLTTDLVLIPSFSTENINETLSKNQIYIP